MPPIDADNLSSEAEQHDDAEATPEIIQQARDMGWVPPDSWKGAPPKSGFLTPQEYIRRGEKIMPIVRAENKKLKDELAAERAQRESDRAEHNKTISRIERMSTLALDQQRQQIESKYADRIERAAEVGDKDAVRQARKEEKEALAAIDEKLKEPEPDKTKENGKGAGLPKQVQEIVDGWKADNPWYSDDDPSDEMTAYATAVHMKLQKEKKGLSLKENLEEVTARVRKRFPEHFGGGEDAGDDDEVDEKPALRGSRVEGGSRMNGGGGARSGWSKVPAEARTAAENAGHLAWFLKDGETMEKNASQARERWAAKYFEGEQK